MATLSNPKKGPTKILAKENDIPKHELTLI